MPDFNILIPLSIPTIDTILKNKTGSIFYVAQTAIREVQEETGIQAGKYYCDFYLIFAQPHIFTKSITYILTV